MAISKRYVAIEGILDGIETYLVDEMTTDGRLDGIVAYGRMSIDIPAPPYPGLWWQAESMPAPSVNTSIRELWTMPVILASLTFSDDPEKGSYDATMYASEAMDILVDSHNVGLDYVNNITSARFVPAGLVDKSKTKFTAMAIINVSFLSSVRE